MNLNHVCRIKAVFEGVFLFQVELSGPGVADIEGTLPLLRDTNTTIQHKDLH